MKNNNIFTKDIINFAVKKLKINNKNYIINNNTKLNDIRAFSDARKGSISWLSTTELKKNNDLIKNFKGSLIIIPPGFIKSLNIKFSIIEVKNPKIIFAQIINYFFSKRLKINWPTLNNKNNISKKAIIGKKYSFSPGVVIGDNVIIENNVSIGPNTVINNCLIKSNTTIGSNCSIGLDGFGYVKDKNNIFWKFPHLGKVIINCNVEIGNNTCIDRGSLKDTIIGSGVKIDNLVHIAHNVEIKSNTLIIANSTIGGSVIIEENVWVAPSSSIKNKLIIKKNSLIGLGAVVINDVKKNKIVIGNPAKELIKKEQ